jgi:hypothetical protein
MRPLYGAVTELPRLGHAVHLACSMTVMSLVQQHDLLLAAAALLKNL